MRVLGILGVAISCVGVGLASESQALEKGTIKASFAVATARQVQEKDSSQSPFQTVGRRHRNGGYYGGGDGCGCGDGGYGAGYRPYAYGRYGYDDYAYDDAYEDGYGYGADWQRRQYGYRSAQVQPGDELVVVRDAELMRGYDVLGLAQQGERLPVLQVQGPWVGTVLERDGRRVGGWIWFQSIASSQQEPMQRGFRPQYDSRQQQPGMQQPGMQQPGMQQPGMQQPGYQQPGMQQPGTQQPGLEPGYGEPRGVQPGGERQPGTQPPLPPQIPEQEIPR